MNILQYDYLKKYVPGGRSVNDNWFFKIDLEEVEEAEKKLGCPFPEELREFYLQIGYGMLRSPPLRPKGYEFYGKNEILPPNIAVDYSLGILEHPEDEAYYMSESFYEDMQPGDLPFFEVFDSSNYLLMKLNSDNPNAVWTLSGIKIEDSFEKFIWRLYYESPTFYGPIIEAHYAK